MQLNIAEAKRLLRLAIKAGRSALLIGSPGIGKTSCIRQLAQELGYSFTIFEASSLDPTDIRGVIVPVNGHSRFTKSPLMPDPAKDGEKGILLIDEIASTTALTQVALNALFLERRLGEHRIPDGWIPMATANYVSDDAGASRILSTMEDRVLLLNIYPCHVTWLREFAIPRKLHPAVVSFISFSPQNFNTFASRKQFKIQEGRTFTTGRSWETLSDLLYKAEAEGIDLYRESTIRQQLVQACTDPVTAKKFDNYFSCIRRIEHYIKRFVELGSFPEELDDMGLQHAFASQLCYLPDQFPDKKEQILNHICRFCREWEKLPADGRFTVFLSILRQHKDHLLNIPEFQPTALAFQVELQNAQEASYAVTE